MPSASAKPGSVFSGASAAVALQIERLHRAARGSHHEGEDACAAASERHDTHCHAFQIVLDPLPRLLRLQTAEGLACTSARLRTG
jgi:hypothetical protein